MIPALQYLRHGKALCGKVFKRFVETFNYHNDFIANLKGDGDLSTSDGCIKLDRTDPTHPVIRLNRNNLGLPDGPSGDGGFPGRFEILSLTPDEPPGSEEEQTYTATFANPFYDIGGKTYEMPAAELEDVKDGSIIYIKVAIGASQDEPTAELGFVAGLQALKELQEDETHFVAPLYRIAGGSVVCDFRTNPTAGIGEF